MTRFSKFSLAALGGATVIMLTSSADAMTVSRFRASIDEVRLYCERIDESFWKKRNLYGCGEKLACGDGSCRVVVERRPQRRPPVRHRDPGGKGGPDGGGDNGGGDNGGGGQGRGGIGAAARN